MTDTLPGWPRHLRREQAAAYVGVSVPEFMREVEAGTWPRPVARGARPGKRGARLTWDRLALDRASDALCLLPAKAGCPPAHDPLVAAALAAADRD